MNPVLGILICLGIPILAAIIFLIIGACTKKEEKPQQPKRVDWSPRLYTGRGSTKIFFFASEGARDAWLNKPDHTFVCSKEKLYFDMIDTKTATEEEVAAAVEKARQTVAKIKMAQELANEEDNEEEEDNSGKDGYRKK